MGFHACSETSDKLTVLEKQAVDTIYLKKIKEIRPLLDSICSVREDSLIKLAADSIVRAREEEIEKIMNRQ